MKRSTKTAINEITKAVLIAFGLCALFVLLYTKSNAAELIYHDCDYVLRVECYTVFGCTTIHHPTGVDNIDWSYLNCDTTRYVKEKAEVDILNDSVPIITDGVDTTGWIYFCKPDQFYSKSEAILEPTHYWLDMVITCIDVYDTIFTRKVRWITISCDTTIDTNWVFEIGEKDE